MKKIKCRICGTHFTPQKENMYLATEKIPVTASFSTPTKTFECFDCPHCGCQTAVNVHMAKDEIESGDKS